MWKELFVRPRQLIGWVILVLLGTYIAVNFESWMLINKWNEHWKILQSPDGAKQVTALTNFMISPFATGFGASTLIFLIWDLVSNYRRLNRLKDSHTIIPGYVSPSRLAEGVNAIKVHAPRKEKPVDIDIALDNLTNAKTRYHNSQKVIRFIEIYIDFVRGIYAEKYNMNTEDEVKLFRAYSDGIEQIMRRPTWLSPLIVKASQYEMKLHRSGESD